MCVCFGGQSILLDPSPGWWEGMVGPGGYIDTNRFRVLCASNLGAPFGTTSPISTKPGTDHNYAFDFPQITPGDQVAEAAIAVMLLQSAAPGPAPGLQH